MDSSSFCNTHTKFFKTHPKLVRNTSNNHITNLCVSFFQIICKAHTTYPTHPTTNESTISKHMQKLRAFGMLFRENTQTHIPNTLPLTPSNNTSHTHCHNYVFFTMRVRYICTKHQTCIGNDSKHITNTMRTTIFHVPNTKHNYNNRTAQNPPKNQKNTLSSRCYFAKRTTITHHHHILHISHQREKHHVVSCYYFCKPHAPKTKNTHSK